MFLRAHSDCRLENRMVVFARAMGKAGRAVSERDRGQWYWCRVTMGEHGGQQWDSGYIEGKVYRVP